MGAIILGITLAVFVAMAIYFIVKIVKGPKLPSGHKFTAKVGGNKAIVVVDKDIPGIKSKDTKKIESWVVGGLMVSARELANKCAMAIQSTEIAFKKKNIKKADVEKTIFYFQTNENFEKAGPFAKRAAAYTKKISGIFGTKETPMAVIRSKHIKTVSERGKPAIHEMVHILNEDAGKTYNRKHDDQNLWAKFGNNTVERISEKNWKELVQAFND